MKLMSLFSFVLLFSAALQSKEKVVVWNHNYEHPYLSEILHKAAAKLDPQIVEYELVPSSEMSTSEAFDALRKGEIDVFIGGTSLEREQQANVVYVPLDRGLLGFRVCLVNQNKPPLINIDVADDVIEKKVSIGVGEKWLDQYVYEDAGFDVVTSPNLKDLYDMLRQDKFDCFSRSVNEIDLELASKQYSGLKADTNILFVYPNSDFMFINPKNKKLHKHLSIGLGRLIEEQTFYDIFDRHYENALIKHGIYERKLVFLRNDNISPRALWAINRFGIASFIMEPIAPLNFAGFAD